MNNSRVLSAVSLKIFQAQSRWFSVLLFLLFAPLAHAYPPAPHHLFYGLVRDEYGSPVNVPGAEVILVTSSGKELKTHIIVSLEQGVNYKLEVPMDAGLTSDIYKPTAMQPTLPFQIKVVINKVTYLPIELKGKSALMGQPGQRTRLDLTLGEDSDGDGLPDAWERTINRDISKVNPNDDLDGDGLTNLQEYIAGTYAVDQSDGLALTIKGLHDGEPIMEFLAIRGRSYTLLGSTDFETWSPVTFRIPAEGANAKSNYLASKVTPVVLEAITTTLQPPPTFFKLRVQ